MMSLKDGPTMLLPMEWRIIEDIIPLLTPFNLMTTELSGGKYPTLDMVIPLVRGVDISLNSKTMETELGVALKSKLIQNMADRFDLIEDNDILPCFAIATVLDPRFKKVAFTNIELANKAIQNIKYELAALIGENSEHSSLRLNHESQENQCFNLWAFRQQK
ncbi:PREDICTED: zinc finger BED domain-containing protein 1-like isoform X2 [Diuraphis noxia]|uniref:zinc finger BED domain-containing protein 1-like isoform X2 n=1 Tax=Diuraphis noxia TaxID=143948 RepID=UPI000763A324|nr:PREDICTED: zinc finger BED domain-containing protein 1-like isoform X2 [Diuraphis noxia]